MGATSRGCFEPRLVVGRPKTPQALDKSASCVGVPWYHQERARRPAWHFCGL